MKRIIIVIVIALMAILAFIIGLVMDSKCITEEEAINIANKKINYITNDSFINDSLVDVTEAYETKIIEQNIIGGDTSVYLNKKDGKLLNIIMGE